MANQLRAEGLRLLLQGLGTREVANRLGVTQRTVQRWRRDAGLGAPPGPLHSEINTELVDEALRQIDEGKIDTEISSSLGIPTGTLRQIRDSNNRPRSGGRWSDNELSVDHMNDIIDMLREGATVTEIHETIGVSKKRIRDFRENEVRKGNPLPDFKKGIAVTQKYSDEELIELAFLNRGYGFDRFTTFLGVRRNFVMGLFLEFKEFTGGEEDPLGCLQDPSNHRLVSEHEYKKITGKTRVPKGSGRATGGRPSKASESYGTGTKNVGDHRDIRLFPQEFNWGEFSPKMWPSKQHSSHGLKGPMSVSEWIENKISEKGYVRFDEDSADFSKSTGAGASTSSFRKWMKRSDLQYYAEYQYWAR